MEVKLQRLGHRPWHPQTQESSPGRGSDPTGPMGPSRTTAGSLRTPQGEDKAYSILQEGRRVLPCYYELNSHKYSL